MKTVTRFATWIDAVATAAIGSVLRWSIGLLAFVLRRGRHRPWRRGKPDTEQRSETSSS